MMTHLELITPIAKFKTSILKSGLCDYSDAFILVKGAMTITGEREGEGEREREREGEGERGREREQMAQQCKQMKKINM